MLTKLQDRLKDRNIALRITDAAKEHLALHGYDLVYGARPLRRLIQRKWKPY